MAGLEGKVAIVTGAGRLRGIGRAIALRLAREGADVVVTAVRRPPEGFPPHEREGGWKGVESVAAEIAGLGRRTIAMDVDVTDAAQVRSMVERTRAELGRVDVLVNNAGLALVGRERLRRPPDRRHRDGGALSGQAHGDGAADAAHPPGAGNDRDLPFEPGH